MIPVARIGVCVCVYRRSSGRWVHCRSFSCYKFWWDRQVTMCWNIPLKLRWQIVSGESELTFVVGGRSVGPRCERRCRDWEVVRDRPVPVKRVQALLQCWARSFPSPVFCCPSYFCTATFSFLSWLCLSLQVCVIVLIIIFAFFILLYSFLRQENASDSCTCPFVTHVRYLSYL